MFREMRRFKQLLPQETAIEILNRNTSGTLARPFQVLCKR